VPDSYLANGCDQLDCATPLQPEARRVTLRQLLSHRGGIQHYSNGVINPTPPRSAVNDPRVNDGIEWATDYFVFNPLVAIPGSAFKYSSFGYNLMGVVLEHALGDTYENLVQMHVGAVLGMQTLSADRFWEAVPNRAVGYRFSGGAAVRDGNTDVSWKLPGGGFISTVVDLARYCGGLQSEVLLSTERREGTLWHDYFQQNYALGFALGTSGGRRLISHTGAQQKAASSLRLYPDEGVCIVVMSNTRPDVARVGYDSAGAIGRQVDSAWRLLEQDAQQ
jgi:serine beta-lactamase-like protein LACTB